MRKLSGFLLTFSLVVGLMLSISNFSSIDVSANSDTHTVTFNYNVERIRDYIPEDQTVFDSLSTYSVDVADGNYAVESTTPSAVIKLYYSYTWSVNGNVVNISNYPITQDTTFTAVWSPRVYKVYFHFPSEDIKKAAACSAAF